MYKKKLQTIIFSTCALGLLGFIIWWSFSQLRDQEKRAAVDIYTIIPKDCKAILEIQDINALEQELSNSYFNQEYSALHISDLLKFLTKKFTILIHQEAHGLSREMSQLLISFHEPNTPDSQIIYGKLGEKDQTIIEELIHQNAKTIFAPKHLTYKGEKITIYPIGKEFMACYINKGFFAISYQKRLIENVIDTYLAQNGINKNHTFEQLRLGHKNATPLLLYVQTTNDSTEKWDRFDIRMNTEAIYVTGTHMASNDDSCRFTFQHFNRIEDNLLPQYVQLIYQHPFEKCDSTSEETESPSNISQQLSSLDLSEVSLLIYSPLQDSEKRHQLLILPIPYNNETKFKQALRASAIRCPNHWTSQASYPIWHYTNDRSLHQYFINKHEANSYYVSLFKNCVLVSPEREGICEYINDMTSQIESNIHANKAMYLSCLNDLAEEANHTMVANLNDIMEVDSLTIQGENILLPFFFKHKDFFKNFMLSTQFIYTNGQQSTNLILTYQSDSILKDKRLE